MKEKIIFRCTVLLIFLFFFISVFYRDKKFIILQQKEVIKNSKLIAESLWSLQPELIEDYLELTCNVENYKDLKVIYSLNKEFISISKNLDSKIDNILKSLHLIRVISFKAEITHNGEYIGELLVQWYNTTIYIYFFEILLISLVLLICWFILRILKDKNELENRVYLRTYDLEKEVKAHKKTALTMEREKELFAITLRCIVDGVITTDTVGNIVVFNTIAEKLTGWKAAEVIGLSLSEVLNIIQEDNNAPRHNIIEEIIKSDDIIEFKNNTLLVSKDGKQFNIDISGSPIHDNENNILGVVFTFSDITEEKILQEKINHNSKMDAIGQLAGGIAHDFNNTLASIIGATEMVLNGYTYDYKQRKFLEMIMTSAERAGELTKKLLLFSRKGNKQSSTIDMLNIISDSVSLLERTINKNITISIENQSTNSKLLGDAFMLQNVIINLVINSSHAMLSGGEITITLKNIILDYNYCKYSSFDIEPGNYLEIDIKDTGSGMSPEIQTHIFEPFFTTKEQGKGTGIGLATVYGTIKDHHGAINLYSEKGVGTVFHIFLPITILKLNQKDDSPIIKGTGTILIIDDEESIRITTKAMLESIGYDVLCASNGKVGLEIYIEKSKNIDLIILDMIMPVMGGRETFNKLREINPKVNILISSGFAKDQDINELNKKGISGFINKPFRLADLSETISKILI